MALPDFFALDNSRKESENWGKNLDES